MSVSFFLSMLSFCFVLSISPGPVNAMIITSSINNGFKRTFSFISGATIGFTLLLMLIAFSYESFLLNENKSFLSYLEIGGSLFIIYMGYKIASSCVSKNLVEKDFRILKFYEGFLLQWLNPKAWLACISGVSLFVISKFTLVVFILMYFIVCYLCLSFWGILGQRITRFFKTEFKLKAFNIIMGSLLVFSASSLLFKNFME